ncbi:MAG: hypothetical protein R3314_14640, partial [Longimicrobiales bacterium]|nr:hypothetical protein [Longimicrobiales bacterium]
QMATDRMATTRMHAARMPAGRITTARIASRPDPGLLTAFHPRPGPPSSSRVSTSATAVRMSSKT